MKASGKLLNILIVGIASLLIGSVNASTSVTSGKSARPHPITAEIAGKYAECAMMASNAYHRRSRMKFPLEELGWMQVDLDGNPTSAPTKQYASGLAYDIYAKQGTNDVVWAIRGTDGRGDFFWANFAIYPLQYKQVNRDFGAYIKEHPSKRVTVCGHSLGGGLALGVSVHYGVEAVTFDASPRAFDSLNHGCLPARRILIYENGDPLELLRKCWRKTCLVFSAEDVYACSFDFGGTNRHRPDYLANGLLNLGATANKQLDAVRVALQTNHPRSQASAPGP